MGLAVVCDLRVANEEARYGANFVRLGLHPGMATTYLLPRLMGVTRGIEFLLTGRIVSGAEAAEAGLVNYGAIPAVVYTHPELASVGLSEEGAKDAGRAVAVGKYQFRANARAHSMDEIDGLVKIVADADTDELLGMHILGPQASHLIAEGVLALEFRASAEDVARTVHAHPSLAEVVKEAAWAVAE